MGETLVSTATDGDKMTSFSWSSSTIPSLCVALPFVIHMMSSQLKFTTTHDLRCIDHYVGTVIILIGALHYVLVRVLVGIVKVGKSLTVYGTKLHKH